MYSRSTSTSLWHLGGPLGSVFPSAGLGTKGCSNFPLVWPVRSDKITNPTNPLRRGPVAHPVMSLFKGRKSSPTTSYSLVTKQALTRGLFSKWVIPTLWLTGTSGSGSFVVVVLWLPDAGMRLYVYAGKPVGRSVGRWAGGWEGG